MDGSTPPQFFAEAHRERLPTDNMLCFRNTDPPAECAFCAAFPKALRLSATSNLTPAGYDLGFLWKIADVVHRGGRLIQ